MTRTFYLASSVNTPESPLGGGSIPMVHRLIMAIEAATGDRCISRWPFHKQRNQGQFESLMAMSSLTDIAQADYFIAVPLTSTARGCHVEMGMSLGLAKPTYLYRPRGQHPVGFDQLCLPPPPAVVDAIEAVLSPTTRQDPGEEPFPED